MCVFISLFKVEHLGDKQLMEFRAEVDVMAKLAPHPNIVVLIGFCIGRRNDRKILL